MKKYEDNNNFSQRLPYANRKIEERFYSMMNIMYKSIEEVNDEFQKLKLRTKLKFYQDFSIYYGELCYLRQNGEFYSERYTFNEDAKGMARIMHEAFL